MSTCIIKLLDFLASRTKNKETSAFFGFVTSWGKKFKTTSTVQKSLVTPNFLIFCWKNKFSYLLKCAKIHGITVMLKNEAVANQIHTVSHGGSNSDSTLLHR